MKENARAGKIITFYSYKGGTGRSMMLANVAWILASQGKHVLVIDWDLEAPGLHHYFHPFLIDKELTSTEGLIDFLTEFTIEALKPIQPKEEGLQESWYEELADISRIAVSLEWDFLNGGVIDFIPAGKQGPAYALLMNSFDWLNFYERLGGGVFLESVKRKMIAKYDYILIDSRTGVSDTAGICTVQMPDVLVVCFTLNHQSIEGAAAVASSVYKQRQRSGLRVLPVPTRVELAEKERLDYGRDYAQSRFAGFLESVPEEKRTSYWGEVEVVYYPYYAYGEMLATFGERPGTKLSLLPALERLTSYITDGKVEQLVSCAEHERLRVLARYTRGTTSSKAILEKLIQNNPEVHLLYEQARQRSQEWRENNQNATFQLDSGLVGQLRNTPRLLALMMEEVEFRLFWDHSLHEIERAERRERIANQMSKLNRAQIDRVVGTLELSSEYLPPLTGPTAIVAVEIVRLVEQRGDIGFDLLEKVIQEMVAAPEISRGPIAPRASVPNYVKVVPKGLRSFDANDADFFLDLLPGPRDNDGLPESIRFWKHRIEKRSDTAFTVGVIYGPSGCGKSSLMKAGLLPRLDAHILAVYVEATGNDTEARLLKGLLKRCPDLPKDLDLTRMLADLKDGNRLKSGQKTLLVIDQFEQWLHAKSDAENSELLQALMECDGEQLQCVLMVRDDYWTPVSRFLKKLEIQQQEGKNMQMVDLFDQRHAKNVLTAFGQAFGVLPSDLSKEHAAFLDQAVAGLAQDGKVICVRLALFAEMVKGKPWTPATLKEVGGIEGVGVTFLEETFSTSTAPPQHRLHQKAAQAVLKALLPDIGSDIRGNRRSQQELLASSGYDGRPKDFEALLRTLDGELRLITPSDPEGVDSENASSASVVAGQKYYQLTHDYLVPSLRDWLTRKQKETRRGRAELVLADRAAAWNARQEKRQLPSLLQWFQINWLTQKKNWTPPQRKMMQKATRYHAVRAAVVCVMLALATITGLVIQNQVVERDKATHAAGLVQAIVNADTAQVPDIIGKMAEYRPWADPLLREENQKAAANSRQKLHASLALLPVDATQVDYLYGRLLDAEPHEVPVIRDFLAPHKDELLDKLWAVVEKPDKGKEPQRLRAAAALAKYDPESQRWTKANALVVNDLVRENAVFLGQWSEAFKFVKGHLLSPLSVTFRDHQPERAAERTLATNLLADYAADNPQVLADLLMDADEKQFAAIYPKFMQQSERGLPVLTAEIDKKPVIVKDKIIFEKKGMIAEGDAKVKAQSGLLPAQRFEVQLQAGKQYRLTMDSKDLDSFLVLQDKTGKELASDDDSGGGLNSLLLYTPSSDDTYTVFAASLANPMAKNTGVFVLKVVETMGGDEGKEKLAKRQANAAVALLKLNQPEKVWPLLKHGPDPRVRSYLSHRFGPLGADAGIIAKRLDEESDVTIRRALILSLGEFDEEKLSPDARKYLLPKLQQIYRADSDPGLHAATEWLLRTWGQDDWLRKINDDWAKDAEQREKRLDEIKHLVEKEKTKTPPQWYVNGQGQTMVVIPGPIEFMMGSPPTETGRTDDESQHKTRISRTFAVDATSVTVEQYRQFDNGYKQPAVNTRTADLPVVGISWYQAAAYCNWLSKQEGIPEDQWCYQIKGQVTKLRENYLSLSGYRLPTEAEMEYVTRAGAVTSRSFGETEELLPKYAWYSKNSREQIWPAGSLKPNDLGLFDVHGNVFTWCQGSYNGNSTGKGEEAAEDQEDGLVVTHTTSRVLRGGSFTLPASFVRSAYRSFNLPTSRFASVGFRVARTLSLDGLSVLPPSPEGSRK